MYVDTNIKAFANVYNFSVSHWEPLLEPFDIGLHVSLLSLLRTRLMRTGDEVDQFKPIGLQHLQQKAYRDDSHQ